MRNSPGQASLFAELPVPGSPAAPAAPAGPVPPAPAPAPRRGRPRSWLCIHLPQLPLEALRPAPPAPAAVRDDAGPRATVVTADEAARALGIAPGLPVNAALALVPSLVLRPRLPRREAACLAALAEWAGRYTPLVSLCPPAGLLLEIGGSARLYGGLEALHRLIAQDLGATGHRGVVSVAPTARAALWLARGGRAERVAHRGALAGQLAGLPVEVTGWPASLCRLLAESGAGQLGQCVRLPRDGLARRLGPGRLRELDEAYGRAPEVLRPHTASPRFDAELTLPVETTDHARLVAAADRLLDRLAAMLRRRQRAVQLAWLHCRHEDGEETPIPIGLVDPTTDRDRLAALLRVHLARVALPAPVIALRLRARLVEPVATAGGTLFDGPGGPAPELPRFLEQLRARLGVDAVHGLRVLSEHRPERAWQSVETPVGGVRDAPPLPSAVRPLWMLPAPLRLDDRAGCPVFRDPLCLESGPERIETGWWDGADVRRDYFVARNRRGMRLWVFRDLRGGGWYLHGLFG